MKPWLRGSLEIAPPVFEVLWAHARACHPEECCGLLLGDAGDVRVDEAMPFDNLADRYHRVDPEGFPRTAKTGYVMDGARVQFVMERAPAQGRAVKAIYHSHPDRAAYFSAEDERMARADPSLASQVAWLVLGTGGQARVFVYEPMDDAFVVRVSWTGCEARPYEGDP